MEEAKRRAEADKLAAITALEQRSRDFMAEKEANRRLEQKIASMQSQLLTGGAALQDTPAFRWGVAQSVHMSDSLELTLRLRPGHEHLHCIRGSKAEPTGSCKPWQCAIGQEPTATLHCYVLGDVRVGAVRCRHSRVHSGAVCGRV